MVYLTNLCGGSIDYFWSNNIAQNKKRETKHKLNFLPPLTKMFAVSQIHAFVLRVRGKNNKLKAKQISMKEHAL